MGSYTRLVVRPLEPRDFEALRAMPAGAHPAAGTWDEQKLRARIAAFPEGQLVAAAGERLLGAAASLVVRWDDHAPGPAWSAITAGGTFATHDPEGRTLYVAEHFAAGGARHLEVARALYAGCRRLCRALGLRRLIAASRMPGFSRVRNVLTPETYAMRVAWGDNADACLAFHLANGFRFCGVVHNYRPEDAESAGHAALVAWINPAYRLSPGPRRRKARAARLTQVVAPTPPALAA